MAADEAASPPATGAIAVAALSADEAASPPATGAIAVTTGPCDPRSTDATKCHVRLRGRKENEVESANLGSCCLNCSSGRPACGEQNGGSGQRSAVSGERLVHHIAVELMGKGRWREGLQQTRTISAFCHNVQHSSRKNVRR